MVAALLAGLTSVLIAASVSPLNSAQAMGDSVAPPALDTDRLNEPALPAEEAVAEEERLEEERLEEEVSEETPEDAVDAESIETEPADGWVVRPYAPLRSPTACPADIETLSALLIRDIPNYTNRVLQRATAVIPDYKDADDGDTETTETNNRLRREPYRPAFVLVAGRPELEPLDLNQYAFTTDPTAGGPLTQLFFTTLSRQYSGNTTNDVQSYHWLFLAESEDGWWLAFMFSQIDDAKTPRAPTPPRESSSGSVGQAVQLWLRDCRAGAIYPLE
ncbi:MAG: hypothetical protein AB8B99_05255 [Phormidesmis sp.]